MEKEVQAINLLHVKNIFDPLYVPTHLLSSIHIYIYTYIYIYRQLNIQSYKKVLKNVHLASSMQERRTNRANTVRGRKICVYTGARPVQFSFNSSSKPQFHLSPPSTSSAPSLFVFFCLKKERKESTTARTKKKKKQTTD